MKKRRGVVVVKRLRLSTRQLEAIRHRGETVYKQDGSNIMGDKLLIAIRWSGR